MRFSLPCRLLVIATLSVATLAAHADLIHVVLAPNGGGPGTQFSVDTSTGTATPGSSVVYDNTEFSTPLKPVNGAVATFTSGTASFFDPTTNGGMDFSYEENGVTLQFSGAQIFAGSESDPGFTHVTVYDLTGLNGAPDITLTVAPEPSSLALLGTGALGLVGTFRRRLMRA